MIERATASIEQMQSLFAEATPAFLFTKLFGALAGSLISIAYVLPRGRREAYVRFVVGFVTGLVFGGPVGIKLASLMGMLHILNAQEVALMGAASASLCAWWALGALKRLSERWPGTMPDPFLTLDHKTVDQKPALQKAHKENRP